MSKALTTFMLEYRNYDCHSFFEITVEHNSEQKCVDLSQITHQPANTHTDTFNTAL